VRALHPETLTWLKQDHYRAILLKINYTPTPVFLTNTAFDVVYNGDTYVANGKLLKIGNPKLSIDIRTNRSTLMLDAVEPSLVSILRNNVQTGRLVEQFIAILKPDYAIAGEPIQLPTMVLEGAPKITNDPEKGKAIIEQKVASEFANWSQKGGRRTTPASQHRFFPNDTGFDFAAESGKQYPWGRK